MLNSLTNIMAAPYRTYTIQGILTDFLARGFSEANRSREQELLFLKWVTEPKQLTALGFETMDKKTYAVALERPVWIPDFLGLPIGNSEADYFYSVVKRVLEDDIVRGTLTPFDLDAFLASPK